MATVAQMIEIVGRHAGFPASRCANTARRLAENGHLPVGSGRSPPHVTVNDVARFLIALAAEPVLRDAAATVERYWRLPLHGKPRPDALHDQNDSAVTAGSALAAILRNCGASKAPGEVPLSLEVVSSWPEVTVEMTNLDGSLTFHEPGGDPIKRQAAGVRRAARIPGIALARIARAALT